MNSSVDTAAGFCSSNEFVILLDRTGIFLGIIRVYTQACEWKSAT